MSKSSSAATKVANQTKAAVVASTGNAASGSAVATPTISCEKIAQRAYEKWQSRGCTHGCDKQDWHEAEMELKAELAPKGNSVTQSRR